MLQSTCYIIDNHQSKSSQQSINQSIDRSTNPCSLNNAAVYTLQQSGTFTASWWHGTLIPLYPVKMMKLKLKVNFEHRTCEIQDGCQQNNLLSFKGWQAHKPSGHPLP